MIRWADTNEHETVNCMSQTDRQLAVKSVCKGVLCWKLLTSRRNSSWVIEKAQGADNGDDSDSTERAVTVTGERTSASSSSNSSSSLSSVGRRMTRCVSLVQLAETADDDSIEDDDKANDEQQTTRQRSVITSRFDLISVFLQQLKQQTLSNNPSTKVSQ